MGKFGNRALPKFLDNKKEDELIGEDNERIQELQEGHSAPEIISIGEVRGNTVMITIKTVEGDEQELEFELDDYMEEVDPPYGYDGSISAEHNGVTYTINVGLVDVGGGDFDIEIEDETIETDGDEDHSEDHDDSGENDEEINESKVLRFDQFNK